MSKLMKVNIIHTVMWGMVAVGLGVIFSLSNTISSWGDNRTKTVLLAILFFGGFLTDFILWQYEKSKKHGFRRDERDKKVQSEAVFKSFTILIIYIFVVSVVLYTKYENAGVMPVGWVWFIAYSTIAATNLLVGVFALIGYKKQGL